MKTTKRSALEKRIDKLVKSGELSKNSNVYKWVIQLAGGETKFRPVFTTGSTWKHSSLQDYSYALGNVFRKLKITFTISNDAPRGGKTGMLFEVRTKVIQ